MWIFEKLGKPYFLSIVKQVEMMENSIERCGRLMKKSSVKYVGVGYGDLQTGFGTQEPVAPSPCVSDAQSLFRKLEFVNII